MPPKKGAKNQVSGKEAALQAAAATQAANAAKAQAKLEANAAKRRAKQGLTVGGPGVRPPDTSFIVFEGGKEKGKDTKKEKEDNKKTETDKDKEPPKPTAKQVVGGQSWTGKLPVNLLSEYCQKQKWERPEYEVRKVKATDGHEGGLSAFVVLSAKNAKTGEVTRLEPFKLPPSHVHLTVRPTALEARHVAATVGLFRTCSMKNMHMTLPPEHRTLWRALDELKAVDVREGRAWMYEADPFAAQRERALAKAAAKAVAEKRRHEQTASTSADKYGQSQVNTRGWTNVPKIEMGTRTRAMLEDLLRRGSVWNEFGVVLDATERAAVVAELSGRLGFRASHAEEAAALCSGRAEALEWLLVHVPEDDLPRWALPEAYTAGVSVASTDLRREGAVARLAQSGYATDLCRKVYDAHGDEAAAACALQAVLCPGNVPDVTSSYDSPEEAWEAELASIEGTFGSTHVRRVAPDVCEVRLVGLVNGGTAVDAAVQFRRAPTYPSDLVVSIVAPSLPAYVRLSIVRQALAYARTALADDEMKMYLLVEWVQQHANGIVERPGPLCDVAAAASAASEQTPVQVQRPRKRQQRPRPRPRQTPDESTRAWQARQATPAQQTMLAARRRLPAWEVRETVVDTVSANQVTIISGETGSGKSTQAVQFVLDDLYAKGLGGAVNMMVTQPRRLSALGLADRVSDERCCTVGDEVGYAIRGESRTTPGRTRITFCTTGVLLRRMQTETGSDDALADVTHVVLDEVHERSLDTDFLLALLRDALARPHAPKLVLMSATMDASALVDYFADAGLRVGTVHIAGRTFPVEDMYLDDVVRATGFGLSGLDARGDDAVAKAIQGLGGRINYALVADTVRAIDAELALDGDTGGILVFLPGAGEIGQVCGALRGDASLHVLPLHAALETREQRRVFAQPPPGRRKVVVATNVAETSITIDDIVAVVDCGRVKETGFDATTGMRTLAETWASRAAGQQRRGRAGRVRPGKCYKLFTRHLEQTVMPDRPAPEMRRVPLEQLCLAVRAMGIVDVAAFLARAPTPPAVEAVDGALGLLRRMGVLVRVGDDLSATDHLTALGRQLALIPADLRCGKLCVFGALFGCLHECVTVAAVLSGRSPWIVPPPDRRALAKAARQRFAGPADGDLLTDLRAVLRWDALVHEHGSPYAKTVKAFCDDAFLNTQALVDMANTRTQLYRSLADIGIRPSTESAESAESASVPPLLLRALTAAAFAPQMARIQLPDQKFAASVSGTVALDPEARTIRYYTRDHGRVFVHPSSTLFDAQGFAGRAAFVSYFQLMATSKVFVRDLTPFNAYTLLLFAGDVALDTLGRGLVVDGWLRLRGWARIGVLVSRLRAMLDRLIARRIGHADTSNAQLDADVLRAVVKLIELDGMDN